MSTKEYIAAMKKKISDLKTGRPVFLAAQDTHVKVSSRIFDKSQNANNAAIGTYANEQYKKRRQKKGRQISKVDLKFEGVLQSDFRKGVKKISNLRMIAGVRVENGNKITHLEERYGAIFRLTPKERSNFKQVLANESIKILK
jgi:hypothetical protein